MYPFTNGDVYSRNPATDHGRLERQNEVIRELEEKLREAEYISKQIKVDENGRFDGFDATTTKDIDELQSFSNVFLQAESSLHSNMRLFDEEFRMHKIFAPPSSISSASVDRSEGVRFARRFESDFKNERCETPSPIPHTPTQRKASTPQVAAKSPTRAPVQHPAQFQPVDNSGPRSQFVRDLDDERDPVPIASAPPHPTPPPQIRAPNAKLSIVPEPAVVNIREEGNGRRGDSRKGTSMLRSASAPAIKRRGSITSSTKSTAFEEVYQQAQHEFASKSAVTFGKSKKPTGDSRQDEIDKLHSECERLKRLWHESRKIETDLRRRLDSVTEDRGISRSDVAHERGLSRGRTGQASTPRGKLVLPGEREVLKEIFKGLKDVLTSRLDQSEKVQSYAPLQTDKAKKAINVYIEDNIKSHRLLIKLVSKLANEVESLEKDLLKASLREISHTR